MDTRILPFKTFDETEKLGVAPHREVGIPAKNAIAFQTKRAPLGHFEVKKVYDSETSPNFNTNVTIRIPKDNFIPNKHAYLRIKFTGSVTGPSAPALVPTYDMLSGSSPIRLLYNKQIVEEMTSKQIFYEQAFHQSTEERMVAQKLHNDTTAANRATNNTNNVDYYILLPKLLANHIHLPTASYDSEWEMQIRVDSLNRITTGNSTTAPTGTISSIQLVCHGINATEKSIMRSMPHVKSGVLYHFHKCTEIVKIISASTTAPVFSFPSLRGGVSHLVFWAVENSKYTSTVPNVLDKSAFVDIGEGEFQFGTAASNDKFTQRPQRLRMMRYNKSAKESMGVQLDADGLMRDLAVYSWEFTPREQMDLQSGTSSGSVQFNGTEQIKLALEGNPTPNVEMRYFFLFYQPTAGVTKGFNTTTTASH